jgi:hypothetical protein
LAKAAVVNFDFPDELGSDEDDAVMAAALPVQLRG